MEKCKLCDKEFKTEGGLKQHMRMKHPVIVEEPEEIEVVDFFEDEFNKHPEINEDEIWLKQWASKFNPSNISVEPKTTAKLDKIYLEMFGLKRAGSCPDTMIRMYMHCFRGGKKL